LNLKIAVITNAEVERAKENPEFRAELFYRDVRPLIESLLIRFDVPTEEKEDFVQELYIAYERALNTFEPKRGTRFTTYLYQILRNALKNLMFFYKKKKGPEVEIKETPEQTYKEFIESLPSIYLTPEQETMYEVSMRQVEELLQEMEDPIHRDILAYLIEGKKPEEIAKELGLTKTQVIAIISGPIYRKVKKKIFARKKFAQEPELPAPPLEPTEEPGLGPFPGEAPAKPTVPEEPEKPAKQLVLQDLKKIKLLKKPKTKKKFLEELKKMGWTEERLVELFGDKFLELFGDLK